MATHLLESGNHKHRSFGSAIPSIAVHGALILAAIHATAHAALKPGVIERSPIVRLRPVAAAHTPRQTSPATFTRVDARWLVPAAIPSEPLPFPSFDTNPATGQEPVVSSRDFGNGALVGPTIDPGASSKVLSAPEVDRQVVVVPGSPTPSYPEALRAAGVQGTVVAAFVVDTLGRVESGSFRLLQPADDRFVAAVKNSLARTRFIPAESRGVKVRQLVEQPFSFVIN